MALPRIAAQNGGAAFLIPWMIFLVTWSLPLLIAEFGLGRGGRRGPIGAFTTLLGRRYAWMGGFVAVTTIMIMFYYSVVTGWTLKYVVVSVLGGVPSDSDAYWSAYSRSVWQPVGFHIVSILTAVTVVSRGVVGGIERANRLLIPMLFMLLLVAVGRALTLEGSGAGLRFLFQPDFTALGDHRIWLEALTQSAWSTGAGWGLLLTYAIYVRRDEDVVVSSVAIGLGNNAASLLAGMAILPTAFALLSTADAEAAMASGNTGLTFIWIPQLFARVPGGSVVLPLFFLALFCAALSSLIAMVELAARVLMDTGMSRAAAVRFVGAAGIVCGIPAAASMAVFENQDWVWGLGLMLSGLVYVDRRGSIRSGAVPPRPHQHRTQRDDARPGVRVGRIHRDTSAVRGHVRMVDVPVGRGVRTRRTGFNPIRMYSLGTCLAQWGLALGLLWLFNGRLAAASPAPAGRRELSPLGAVLRLMRGFERKERPCIQSFSLPR